MCGSTSRSTLSTQQCPHVFSPQQACTPVPPPAARRTRRQREVHVRTRRQVEADETGCSAGEVHKRAAAARRSPVRGRGPVRGRAGVPAPPGEPGVGERREAAGAGPGSSWGRGAQLQPARRGRRACGGGHARTGVLRGGARSEYCATAWRTGAAAARGGGAAWELLVPELTPPR